MSWLFDIFRGKTNNNNNSYGIEVLEKGYQPEWKQPHFNNYRRKTLQNTKNKKNIKPNRNNKNTSQFFNTVPDLNSRFHNNMSKIRNNSIINNIITSLQNGTLLYNDIDESLKNNKKIIMTAIKLDESNLRLIPIEYQHDKDFIIDIIKKQPLAVLYVIDEFKEDIEIIATIILKFYKKSRNGNEYESLYNSVHYGGCYYEDVERIYRINLKLDEFNMLYPQEKRILIPNSPLHIFKEVVNHTISKSQYNLKLNVQYFLFIPPFISKIILDNYFNQLKIVTLGGEEFYIKTWFSFDMVKYNLIDNITTFLETELDLGNDFLNLKLKHTESIPPFHLASINLDNPIILNKDTNFENYKRFMITTLLCYDEPTIMLVFNNNNNNNILPNNSKCSTFYLKKDCEQNRCKFKKSTKGYKGSRSVSKKIQNNI